MIDRGHLGYRLHSIKIVDVLPFPEERLKQLAYLFVCAWIRERGIDLHPQGLREQFQTWATLTEGSVEEIKCALWPFVTALYQEVFSTIIDPVTIESGPKSIPLSRCRDLAYKLVMWLIQKQGVNNVCDWPTGWAKSMELPPDEIKFALRPLIWKLQQDIFFTSF